MRSIPERFFPAGYAAMLLVMPGLTTHLLTLNAWLALAWVLWLGLPMAAVYLGVSRLVGSAAPGFRPLSGVLLGIFLVLFGLWLDFRTLGFFTYVRLCQALLADAHWVLPQTYWQAWQFKPWTLLMMGVMSVMVVGHRPSWSHRCVHSLGCWALMLLVMGVVERAVLQSWPPAQDAGLEVVLLSALVLAMALTPLLSSRLLAATGSGQRSASSAHFTTL
ncbi:MAG: hypothetical protein ACX931_15070 [Saccharospirillum sp.]